MNERKIRFLVMKKIKMESQKLIEEGYTLFFSCLFFGLLMDSEPFEGPTSLASGGGRKGCKQPQNPENSAGGAELAAAPCFAILSGSTDAFFGGLSQTRLVLQALQL